MGAFASKPLEEINSRKTSVTPESCRTMSREFDPRSPSGCVSRTPIQVQNTPKQGVLVDPRSPTNGIDRTPIYGTDAPSDLASLSANSPMSELVDPRSPSHGIDRTPIQPAPLSQVQGDVSMSPGGHEVQDEKETSQESVGDRHTTHYDSLTDLLPSTAPTTTPTNKGSKKKKKAKSLFKIHTSPPKDSPQSQKTKSNIKTPGRDMKSSPLGSRNVDYNSPRAIVQRKQTDKLSLMKSNALVLGSSSPRYRVMHDDKENSQQ